MCVPNHLNQHKHWSITDTPYYRGNQVGKIAGSLSAMSIVGALYAAGSMPFPGICVVLLGLSSGCMGYLTGSEAGAHLSKMWYSQNSGEAISSIPGILGGGILGGILGVIGGLIVIAPFLIASYYSDLPPNKETPDELIINNTKFTIGYSQNPFDSVKNETKNNTELNGELSGENIEV